jgi:small subunit ribosomal protein S8
MPASKTKIGVADVLQREGYIWDYEVIEQQPQNSLRVNLKYGPNGERVVQYIARISKPGRRVYTDVKSMPRVLQGLGISVLSTNKGILSNREAGKQNVGGEVLCEVY